MKNLLLTISLAGCCVPAFAQNGNFADSLQLQAGTTGTVATQEYLPLWLTVKRFGTISDRKSDLSTYLRLRNAHRFGQEEDFYLRYGISLYNNNHFRDVFFEEAFARVGYRKWEIRGGRYEEMLGEADQELSSGAWGISGNALPIPKIGIALTEYADVPFTNGWLQVKGQFSHGWMGKEQYIRNAYLHEKTLYLRIGKERLKVYGGIQHFAVWGGNRSDLPKIKNSFSDYLNIVIGKEGDDGTVINEEIAPNRPGDHRGVLEGGVSWENEALQFMLYNQSMFETGQNISIKNTDRLLGLSYRNKNEDGALRGLTLEFINTKKMNSWDPLRVRESYYNNGIYLTGWEYQGRIIGTPLFINRQRGQHYFSDIRPYDWSQPKDSISGRGWNIISNRVTGLHLGGRYRIGTAIQGRTLITYTKNFGNYQNTATFNGGLTQWYTLQEIQWNTPLTGFSVTGGLAADWGKLGNNTGFMLGARWSFGSE
ncbi:capsule assembly Wzi family protein [Chitinophaga alhagiae]|uniref:capsule assembly Wzi family protein n=1 Tax=Chitinophaga alhagiae TaxID=2203219 RepID=UPI000E5ADE7E|nr:capsule assembly Wzi family protein [Chitinophaga alhagiae]